MQKSGETWVQMFLYRTQELSEQFDVYDSEMNHMLRHFQSPYLSDVGAKCQTALSSIIIKTPNKGKLLWKNGVQPYSILQREKKQNLCQGLLKLSFLKLITCLHNYCCSQACHFRPGFREVQKNQIFCNVCITKADSSIKHSTSALNTLIK